MTSPIKIWRHQKEISRLLGKDGRIISFTLIKVPPIGYEGLSPYPVVLIRLMDGEKLVGQMVDWEEKDLRIGRKVKIIYRRIRQPDSEGIISYGLKLIPL